MPNVWLAIPSARPANEVDATLDHWRMQGYQIALYLDADREGQVVPQADVQMFGEYEGYAKACNLLVKYLIEHDPDAQWFVCAGDDTLPDPSKTAEEIAAECEEHFGGTFGVLQCTGHRWGENEAWARQMHPDAAAYIDRICGSPFIGREFARRAYQGFGPWWPEFPHMFADEHLQNVANKLGILWQRRDLTHFHNHWGLTGDASRMPAFLAKANTPEHWSESKAIFDRLKAGGFKEAEDLLPA